MMFAGSINGTGVLEVEVTSSAADNSLARIVAIVEAERSRKGRQPAPGRPHRQTACSGDHGRGRADRRHRFRVG